MTAVPPIQKRRWPRDLILLIALFVLLIGINAITPGLLGSRTVYSGAPGELLYAAGFDGFFDEWQQYRGRPEAQILDGAMQINVEDAGRAAWSAAAPDFLDVDIEVVARAVEGPENNGYGILFRFQQSSPSCDFAYPLACDLSRVNPWLDLALRQILRPTPREAGISYDQFLISSSGFYSLWRVENGVDIRLSTWIQSPLIRQGIGAENRLRVVVKGNESRFYINGELVELCIPNNPGDISTFSGGECLQGQMLGQYTDPTPSGGRVGVIVVTEAFDPGVVVEFDRFVIHSPR